MSASGLDASNVEVAVTGRVCLAPIGTTAPTDSETPLDVAWRDVGYISEDGVTETPEADNEVIRAWQNGDEVRTVQTSHSIQYGFTMIETNEVSLEAYYGDYDSETGNVKVTGRQLPRQMMVIETFDEVGGVRMVRRRLAEVAQVTERGEVSLSNSDATGYEVTVTCYPGADGVTKVHIFAATPADGGS